MNGLSYLKNNLISKNNKMPRWKDKQVISKRWGNMLPGLRKRMLASRLNWKLWKKNWRRVNMMRRITENNPRGNSTKLLPILTTLSNSKLNNNSKTYSSTPTNNSSNLNSFNSTNNSKIYRTIMINYCSATGNKRSDLKIYNQQLISKKIITKLDLLICWKIFILMKKIVMNS